MLDQFDERRTALILELNQVAALGREIGAESVSERLEREVVAKLLEGAFHLVVVGEFNHGKTSFVNALLGAPVLPVGVTPTTARIHHVVYAEAPRARWVESSGRSSPVEVAELWRYAAGVAGQSAVVSETNQEVAPGVGAVVSEANQEAGAEGYLELGYPSPLLQSGVLLVDTPGVNDLSLTRAEITYGYIPRADAVLFLLDAGQPLKESERGFLAQLLARSRDKIVFVVTKADIWTPEERAQALSYIEAGLAELVPAPQLFAVSSSLRLAALASDPSAPVLGAGFPELLAYLSSYLEQHRASIVIDNAAGEGLRALASLGHGLAARRLSATLTEGDLARRLTALEESLAGQESDLTARRLTLFEAAGGIKVGARRDLDRFVDELVVSLPKLLEETSGQDVRLHLSAYVEREFRGFLERLARSMGGELEALAERMVALVQEDASQRAEALSVTWGGALKAPRIEVDTFAYDFGILAVMTVGPAALFANVLLGGALLVAAPAFALWQRGRNERAIKRRAEELLPEALRAAAAKVAPELDRRVDEFVQALDRWVTTASHEQGLGIVQVLQKVQASRREAEQDVAKHQAESERLAERLEALTERLSAVRVVASEARVVEQAVEGAVEQADAPAACAEVP